MKNTCTQVTICFFTAKYKILQFYSNGHSFFLVKYEIRIVPFVLWLWNTKLLKLLRNCHFLFADKLKNLKLHPNWHSFFFYFFYWTRNTKSEVVLKRPFFFWLETTKIELNYLLFQWKFNNSKNPDKAIR